MTEITKHFQFSLDDQNRILAALGLDGVLLKKLHVVLDAKHTTMSVTAQLWGDEADTAALASALESSDIIETRTARKVDGHGQEYIEEADGSLWYLAATDLHRKNGSAISAHTQP